MKYCSHCKRLSAGKPTFCPYCGRSYEVRICKRCRHISSKQVLFCQNCGSQELSEIAGDTPFWLTPLKILFWLFVLLLVIGFVRSLVSFLPFLIIIILLLLSYHYLPEEVKKIISIIIDFIKQRVLGIKKES
jgi:RNA polymerase subunit RPABC4/transcription elongation factor Spt4